ncbi:hypothetical protein FB106_11278 [Synechococcus sp. Ace-Pa]|nr:hypothetical protein FB106_11278 [Synechococcus sp. Ace-Pa]
MANTLVAIHKGMILDQGKAKIGRFFDESGIEINT